MNDKLWAGQGERIGIEEGDIYKSTFVMGGKTDVITGCVDDVPGFEEFLADWGYYKNYYAAEIDGLILPSGIYDTDKYDDSTARITPPGAITGGIYLQGGKGAFERDGFVNNLSGHLLYTPGIKRRALRLFQEAKNSTSNLPASVTQ